MTKLTYKLEIPWGGRRAPDKRKERVGLGYALNRLTSLTDSSSGQFGFGYDGLGRRTSLTRPNGVDTSYAYDSLSRLPGVLHQVGSASIGRFGFAQNSSLPRQI
jgi:YD repeat-containing protein